MILSDSVQRGDFDKLTNKGNKRGMVKWKKTRIIFDITDVVVLFYSCSNYKITKNIMSLNVFV